MPRSGENLDERSRCLDGTRCRISDLVDYRIKLLFRALYCLLRFIAEAFRLLLEVIPCFLKIIACVFYALTKLLASLRAGLRGIKQRNACAGDNTHSKSEPVISCRHGLPRTEICPVLSDTY